MYRINRKYENESNEGGDECVDRINERLKCISVNMIKKYVNR